MEFVSDLMQGTNWQWLTNRSGAVGATWYQHSASTTYGRWYIYGNRAHHGLAVSGGASNYSLVYASGIPDSADYTVSADYRHYSSIPGLNLGICGRVSTSADTYYAVYYNAAQFVLMKRIAGVTTSLGTWNTALSATTYEIALDMVGTTIRFLFEGVERISVTDSSITSAGRVGLRAIGVNDAATGQHIDALTAEDASAPVAAGRTQAIFVGL